MLYFRSVRRYPCRLLVILVVTLPDFHRGLNRAFANVFAAPSDEVLHLLLSGHVVKAVILYFLHLEFGVLVLSTLWLASVGLLAWLLEKVLHGEFFTTECVVFAAWCLWERLLVLVLSRGRTVAWVGRVSGIRPVQSNWIAAREVLVVGSGGVCATGNRGRLRVLLPESLAIAAMPPWVTLISRIRGMALVICLRKLLVE